MAQAESDLLLGRKQSFWRGFWTAHKCETLAILLAYVVFGTSMSTLNKEINIHMGLPITVALINMLFNTFCFLVLLLGTTMSCIPKRVMHAGSRNEVLRWARLMPTLFALKVGTSMLASHHNSVGLYQVIR